MRTLNILVLFCSVCIFLSCGNNESDRDLIRFNVPANANLLKALREDLPEFEREYQVDVELIPFTGQDKLYAMIAAGNPPDIFYTNTVVRDRLASEGHLVDLYTVAEGDSFVDQVRPEFVRRGLSVDGGWYQFCDWTYTFAVYYNESLFKEAGIEPPDMEWTWSGLIQRGRALTADTNNDGDIDRYGLFIPKHFVSALEQMNGATYPPNMLFYDLHEESREALNDYIDLIYKEKIMPELAYTQAQGMQGSQMLNTGRVAMIVEALPNLDFIQSLTIDWDVAPIPRRGDKPPRYFRSSSGGLSISTTSPVPAKAWELIKWLVTQSRYNTPNPVLKGSQFVAGWEEKHPQLKQTSFRDVWEQSVRYDAGDIRNFVRYSSWSSPTILETIEPKMDLFFAGKLGLDDIVSMKQEVNERVIRELQSTLESPKLLPQFRQHLETELMKRGVSLADE